MAVTKYRLQRGIDVTYSPDVAKPIVVKSNKHTTWRISKSGRFLHLKMTRTVNVAIF